MAHDDENVTTENGADESELEVAIDAELDEEDRTAPSEDAVVGVLLRESGVRNPLDPK